MKARGHQTVETTPAHRFIFHHSMSHAHCVADAHCSTRHQPSPDHESALIQALFASIDSRRHGRGAALAYPTHAPTKRDFMSQCNIFSTLARRQFVGSTLTTHDAFCPRSLVRRLRSVTGRRQVARALSLMLRGARRHCVHRRDDASAARSVGEPAAARRADGRVGRAAVRGPGEPAGAAVVDHRRQPRFSDGRRRLRDLDRRPGRCGRARCRRRDLRDVRAALRASAVGRGRAHRRARRAVHPFARLRLRAYADRVAVVRAARGGDRVPRAHRTPLSARRGAGHGRGQGIQRQRATWASPAPTSNWCWRVAAKCSTSTRPTWNRW